MAKAKESMAAEGVALARRASTIPRCPPKPGDQIVAGDGLRNQMSPELAAVAEQTIARAYPGSKLVLGDRAAYLVDASGAAEEILIFPNAERTASNLYAFGVTFPHRVKASEAAATAFQTDEECRAPAEVIVANLDPATRAVTGIQRVEIDRESTSSVIGTLDFSPSSYGGPTLVASYLATYGAPQWYGQVKWNALIEVNHALTVTKRAPTSGGKSDSGGDITIGLLVPDRPNNDDAFGFSLEPGPTTQMSVLDVANLGAAKHIFLLAGPDGLASGWALLSQL